MDTPINLWLPHIIYSEPFSGDTKLILAEIVSLLKIERQQHCWATNDHFSKMFSISKRKVSYSIQKLIKEKWIFSETLRNCGQDGCNLKAKGLHRHILSGEKLNNLISSQIKKNTPPRTKIVVAPLQQNSTEGSDENRHTLGRKSTYPRTIPRITSNTGILPSDMDKENTKEIAISSGGDPATPSVISEKPKRNPLEEKTTDFLDAFNDLFGTKYKPTEGRKKKLGLRLKSFSMEELLESATNLSRSSFHTGKNDRGWKADPDFLLRADEQVDKWRTQNKAGAKPPKKEGLLSDLIPDSVTW